VSRIESRRHGIVLARPLLRAFLLALAGAACVLAPWPPAAAGGAVLLGVAAVLAVTAVARWDRTHVVVTGDSLVVVHGLLHRATASVVLAPGTVVEVERTLLGRVLGYGTVVAGELEIDGVPQRVASLFERPR
jgi:membrane protein YdbS with pleckstrin-like domain